MDSIACDFSCVGMAFIVGRTLAEGSTTWAAMMEERLSRRISGGTPFLARTTRALDWSP